MRDLTREIRVTGGALCIPGELLGESMEIILAADDICTVRLYSDIEPTAGVDAVRTPSSGPGAYPRSDYTQTVYFALEIQTRDHGKLILPRNVKGGLIDCLCLAEQIEDRMGVAFEHRDDVIGRTYLATSTFVILTALILGLLFGS